MKKKNSILKNFLNRNSAKKSCPDSKCESKTSDCSNSAKSSPKTKNCSNKAKSKTSSVKNCK